ncbi:MAG: pilus assembly PilX N-terminal domain-containing protein [Deltaproteobacteria bacterium]|jgi:uncharacterized protein YycO
MKPVSAIDNQRGSALVIALLMLVVLTLIGISATTTTTFELQIATNDKLFKSAFYAADGATEMCGEVIEQNIEERDWDNKITRGNLAVLRVSKKGDGTFVDLTDGNLYMNRDDDFIPGTTEIVSGLPTDDNYDLIYPLTAVDTGSWTLTGGAHTSMKAVGNTTLSTGSAVQLIAGYEGKGKGASAGGAWITYDVRANRNDVRNTRARILLGWRHVL